MEKEILELLMQIQKDNKEFKEEISKQMNNMNNKLNNIEIDINKLKINQEEIKNLIVDLEPKNGNRHIELINSINDLRKNLSTVEIVTANNYADIAKLKAVK